MSFSIYGQQSIYKKAILTADSILVTRTNSEIFNENFAINNEIKYDSTKLISKIPIKIKNKKIIDYFDISYYILINDSILRTYESTGHAVYGDYATIHIKLDSSFKLIEPIDFSMFPKYILKRKPNPFIDRETSMQIAEKSFTETKNPPFNSVFTYYINRKKFVWNISNIFYFYADDPSWEHIFIDAKNKKLIEHHYSGPIH
jgi:hypothetical protein